eukprot:SAG31_NODE_4919_length_2868_cov_1.265800_5_plen_95_part_00
MRTKTTKRSARMIVEKYYSRLTSDFQTNKRVCEEVALIPTKRLRNKIAGYITVRHHRTSSISTLMPAPDNPKWQGSRTVDSLALSSLSSDSMAW